MPDIHGDIGGGKFGVMSSDQILDWLCGKLPHIPSSRYKSNMQSCINDVMNGRGKDTAGRTHQGDQILHTSAGKNGQSDGCTLFYVKRDHGVAKIVGIGEHASSTTYDVYWYDGNWCSGGRISL
ncbi:MAG: hypothetical protein KDK70_28870 [Myxococcales bacterium]|nr:hypothetical protein [Myxococcales bacterium]